MTSMLIARDGHEFELPLDHLIRFYRGGDGRAGYIVLDAPEQGGSLFRVREIEERPGALVVHVADEFATVGRTGDGRIRGGRDDASRGRVRAT